MNAVAQEIEKNIMIVDSIHNYFNKVERQQKTKYLPFYLARNESKNYDINFDCKDLYEDNHKQAGRVFFCANSELISDVLDSGIIPNGSILLGCKHKGSHENCPYYNK